MISVEELSQLCLNKKVFIWGGMIVGQGVCRSLERNGIRVESFIDKSLSLQGRKALGYSILKPDDVFAHVHAGQGIIITGSGHNSPEIASLCEQEGFQKGKDYILCEDLNDIDPSVDIAGMCNLKCISCPRGNEKQQPPAGFMSASTYKKVLTKLINEIPLLGSIQLYAWGEPLLNPELPEIIAITREAKVLSAISSNLNYAKNLEAVIAARPDWFKVSCSGWADNYEMTHTGGKWKVFLSNLHKLANLRDTLHPEMQIILNYHLYKHNTGEDYHRIEALCKDLSLIFIPNHAYLYPLDSVMDFVDGKELSPQAKETIPMLLMTLEEGIARTRERASLPCPEERCLPINWDCRVRECGVFFRPFIADNFLEIPFTEIMSRKRSSKLCIECRKRAIHQFTSVYLAEKRLDNLETGK
jgi:wyosine [tRNA(Phe)-imidazoG37] synthetase (radical SAM superfamily)